MVNLLNFTVAIWTIFFVFLKISIRLWLASIFKYSTPEFKFHYKKRAYETTPILDVLNTCSDRLITSVYRKSLFKDFTGLQQFWTIYTQKRSLKTLIEQAFCLNNTWDGCHLGLQKLKVILQKNEYPPKLVDKSINKYLSKKIMSKPSETETSKTKENIWYFKLPFIGKNFQIHWK